MGKKIRESFYEGCTTRAICLKTLDYRSLGKESWRDEYKPRFSSNLSGARTVPWLCTHSALLQDPIMARGEKWVGSIGFCHAVRRYSYGDKVLRHSVCFIGLD